jgi:uncharacterized protein
MPTIQQAAAWYPAYDAVHGFDHILRVLALAEHIALAEGADLEIVRAAALLHDAHGEQQLAISDQPSVVSEQERLNHHLSSADFAAAVLGAEGWPLERIAAVQHCIRAHRFRDDQTQPQTLEAQVLFDADKLDAIGATGVARAIGYAVQSGQPAYATPSTRFLQTNEKEPGEPHSAYHEYLFKLRKLKDRLFTPTGRLLAVQRHRLMEDFFSHLEQESKPLPEQR